MLRFYLYYSHCVLKLVLSVLKRPSRNLLEIDMLKTIHTSQIEFIIIDDE